MSHAGCALILKRWWRLHRSPLIGAEVHAESPGVSVVTLAGIEHSVNHGISEGLSRHGLAGNPHLVSSSVRFRDAHPAQGLRVGRAPRQPETGRNRTRCQRTSGVPGSDRASSESGRSTAHAYADGHGTHQRRPARCVDCITDGASRRRRWGSRPPVPGRPRFT